MSSKKKYFNDESSDLSPLAIKDEELLKSGDSIDVMMSKINKVFRMLKNEAIQRPVVVTERELSISGDMDQLIQLGLQVEQFNSTEATLYFKDSYVEDISEGRVTSGYKFKSLVSLTGNGNPHSSLNELKVLQPVPSDRMEGQLRVSIRFNESVDVHSYRKAINLTIKFIMTDDKNLI